jgi:hypothetical protein
MKRIRYTTWLAGLISLLVLSQAGAEEKYENIEECFVNPPDSVKPWVYWVWFAGGGRWSKEGATADLEAMKAVGINGVLWNPPFRVDITAVVKPGENALEIVVANVWANRLIGDMLLPAEKRITPGGVKLKENAPLAESGLLGPVRIAIGERAEVVFSQ